MDATVVILQTVVPLALLAWLAIYPATCLLGLLMQIGGSGLILLAGASIGIWVMPPWWFLQLIVGLWAWAALSAVVGWYRSSREIGPRGVPACLGFLFATGMTVFGGGVVAHLNRTEFSASSSTVEIVSPFQTGVHFVVNGGPSKLTNAHVKTLDRSIERFRKWRGQWYGIDYFRIDALGLRTLGLHPADPKQYLSFGTLVYAPCAGRVIARESGLPDMRVPAMDRSHMLGNHVLLDCNEFWLLLAHFRQDTVSVRPGEIVSIGTALGEVGNSGNSSEPHLHIHAQRPGSEGALISGEPLALSINGQLLAHNDILTGSTEER